MYPQLYHAHHIRNLEDLPFWLELASRAGGPILELGCGTGRVLIPLAQAGYHTIGLDNDPAMLKFLQSHLRPDIQYSPELIEADITEFDLARQFPLIILPCNTISTLSNEQRVFCLGCVRRHLRYGGIFAVSLPNPELLLRLPTHSKPEIEEEFIYPETGNPVQVSSSWRRKKNTFNVTWTYDHLLPDGTVDRMEVNSTHQVIDLSIYRADLENSGFVVTELFGDFDNSAYTSNSPHLIILASPRSY
jgi:SAM-dependent methyltransferase